MNDFENVISIIDWTLDTNRKRHIMGGILISVSLFFGGLAFTVMTISEKESNKV